MQQRTAQAVERDRLERAAATPAIMAELAALRSALAARHGSNPVPTLCPRDGLPDGGVANRAAARQFLGNLVDERTASRRLHPAASTTS